MREKSKEKETAREGTRKPWKETAREGGPEYPIAQESKWEESGEVHPTSVQRRSRKEEEVKASRRDKERKQGRGGGGCRKLGGPLGNLENGLKN